MHRVFVGHVMRSGTCAAAWPPMSRADSGRVIADLERAAGFQERAESSDVARHSVVSDKARVSRAKLWSDMWSGSSLSLSLFLSGGCFLAIAGLKTTRPMRG